MLPAGHVFLLPEMDKMSLMDLSGNGGDWQLKSKTDPRWNREGSSGCCGRLQIPPECKTMIGELERLLGDIPKDLEWSYTKY